MTRESLYVIKIRGIIFMNFVKKFRTVPLLIRTILIQNITLRLISQPQSKVRFCVVVILLLFTRKEKDMKTILDMYFAGV
jgi:hypothetical protein